jgi:hypothetical protein
MATATAEPIIEAAPAREDPFRWASYVHVGDGAQDCPDNGARCTDAAHLHAWLRLPNPFVRDDIREHALAARARRLRQLRDPESSTAMVLEGDIEDLRYEAERDGTNEPLIDRVILKDWGDRHLRAMRDAANEDDFRHIEADRERYRELDRLPDEERNEDEFSELDAHIKAYGQRVDELVAQAEKPVRESLSDHSVEALLDIIRDDFRTAQGNQSFYDTWLRLCLVGGAYRPEPDGKRPVKPLFAKADELGTLTPDEANALRAAFVQLEGAFQQGLGNG